MLHMIDGYNEVFFTARCIRIAKFRFSAVHLMFAALVVQKEEGLVQILYTVALQSIDQWLDM